MARKETWSQLTQKAWSAILHRQCFFVLKLAHENGHYIDHHFSGYYEKELGIRHCRSHIRGSVSTTNMATRQKSTINLSSNIHRNQQFLGMSTRNNPGTEQEFAFMHGFMSSWSLKMFLFQRNKCLEFHYQVGVHEPVDLSAQYQVGVHEHLCIYGSFLNSNSQRTYF